jgi:hypothetical protein
MHQGFKKRAKENNKFYFEIQEEYLNEIELLKNIVIEMFQSDKMVVE